MPQIPSSQDEEKQRREEEYIRQAGEEAARVRKEDQERRLRNIKVNEEVQARLDKAEPLGPRPVIPVMGQDLGGGMAERRIVPDINDPIRDAPEVGTSVWTADLARPAAPEGPGPIGMGSGGPLVKASPKLSEGQVVDLQQWYAEKEAGRQSAEARSRLMQGADPEVAAKALDLAGRTGRSRLEVQQDVPGFSAIDMADRIDRLRASAPKLRTWLDETPDNFDIAHDDTDSLEWWEYVSRPAGALASGVVDATMQAGANAIQWGINAVNAEVVARDPEAAEAGKIFTGAADALGVEARKAGAAIGEYLAPRTGDATLDSVLDGTRSLGNTAVWIGAAIIKRDPSIAMGGMSATTAVNEYGRGRDEGLAHTDAARFGSYQGLIEGATEMLPMKWLVGDIVAKTPIGETILRQLGAEIPSEQVATLLQDMVDWAEINPEKSLGEFVAERPDAAYRTLIATAVGTAAQTGIAKAADAGAEKLDQNYQQKRAEEIANMVRAMGDKAAGSKLLTRLPDKYREAVAALTKDGPIETIRVDSEAFNELAQTSGVGVERLAQAFRIDAAEALTAIEAGQDVLIPSGNYAAVIQTAKKEIGIGGTEIHTAFAPNIRLRADDFTAKEVDAMKTVAADEQAARAASEGENSFADAADRVREDSRQRLAATGRFNAETTAIQSSIPAEFIITLAERTGQDPEALWKDFAARTESKLKTEEGELAQSMAREPVPIDDRELELASKELEPKQFEAWKGARDGLSNEQIAERMNEAEPDAIYTPEQVKQWLFRARGHGYDSQKASWYDRGLSIETQRVINMKARGVANKDIAQALFPERETAKARNQVNVLVNRHKALIAEKRQALTGELPQEQRGGFTGMNLSQEAVIRLYESANLSTFVHETAHWYLTTLEKMGRMPDAHPFVIEQLAAVRNWAGKHPEFEIYDEAGQITPEGVEVQEMFAETFEAYLREGRAPSSAMRSVFAAFKSWLMRVYKQLTDIGGRVRLDAEITAVFDRALATDEAITAARKGMDQNATQMAQAMLDKGVITQKQFDRTKARLLEAKEKAEADLMARLMEQYERNQKTWWREEERDIRRDVQSEIDERPEQRAYAWLAGDGWRDTLEDHVEQAAQQQLELAQEQGLFETNATDDTLKLLQMRAVEAGLGPLILLFKTTSGRVIAFPGDNGQLHHDLARTMFGLGDLKMQHGLYNPRKWPTIEAMNAAGVDAWYDTTGTEQDAETRVLAQRNYRNERAREEVRQALAFLKDNPEYENGPLSKIMEMADASVYAADRARRLFRKGGELKQSDGPLMVYRVSAEDEIGVTENGRLGLGLYSAEDPEIGAEWGGASGKVEAYQITGKLFDLTEETAQGIENYEMQENTPEGEALISRLKAEGYVGIRDPWSGHINVFDAKDMARMPDADLEMGNTWTNDPELAQFGGERGRTFPADMKQRAVDMEDSGLGEGEIWRETGLARGADGKWRYEIDDSKATFLPKLDEVDALGFGESVPVGEVLQHKALFAAYPELMRIKVSFQSSEAKEGGFWNAWSNQIVITRGRKVDMRSVLLHELQHAVQDIERFASGGNFVQGRTANPAWIAFQSKAASDPDLQAFLKQRDALARQIAQAEKLTEHVKEAATKLALRKMHEIDLAEVEKIEAQIDALYEPIRKAIDVKYPEVRALWRQEHVLRAAGKLPHTLPARYITGMDVYYALAGETEARNVQRRERMTAEQRADQPPQETEWPKREAQIVRFNGRGGLAFGGRGYGGVTVRTPEFDGPGMLRKLLGEPSKYLPWHHNKNYKALAAKAGKKVEDVAVVKIVPGQPQIRWNFREIPARYGAKDDDLPILVRENGVYYINDGTHRIAAQVYEGAATIRAQVIDLDAGGNAGVQQAGQAGQEGELAQTRTAKGRTAPPPGLSPMRLDLRAVEEQYGPEALAALPPKVRAYSANATDADQFVELARDISQTLKKKKPKSLWKFLSTKRQIGEGNDKISYSGIRDDGGEIFAMIGAKKEAPGLIADKESDGKRARSYSIEEAARAAWEEGYFNGESPPGPAEFLDVLRGDFDGTAKVYTPEGADIVAQIDNANEWANWFDQNEIDISEESDAVLRATIETKLSSQTENAIGPDEAAPFFKMPDGRALLEGLKQGPQRDKLIREETRRRMIAKHGDIFNDGTMAQEAAALARNEVQQRQYEIELTALANASGKQAAANLARETARELLRDKQVREVLNYNQWAILEQRWGKKALEAAEKGDFAKAADFKRYQAINAAMFREARKLAETKIEPTRKHLLDFGSKTKRARLLAAGQEYLEQMTGLLDDYQFRPESRKGENKRQARGEWIRAQMASIDPYAAYQDNTKTAAEQQVEAAEALERSQTLAGLAEGTEAKNFKSITVDELLSVRDEADMIWKLATLKDRLIKEGERRRLSLAADDIAAEIIANQPNAKPPEPIETDSPGYKVKRSVLKYFAMHRTLQSLARQFAGDKDNGVFWRYIVKPLNEAFARLSSIRKEMGTEVDKLFSAYTKDEQRRMFRDRQTFDFRQSGGPRITLSKQGRLAFALNWGNAKNRQRLMDSLGLEAGHVQQVLNTLDKRDWDFVQATWDYLDTWFPEANRVHESVHGAPMDKEAPLEIATQFGVYRGGYYPIKFDPMLSSKTGQRKMEADAKSFTGQVGARNQPGFSKSRVKGKVTLPLRLSVLDVITSHLDQVAVSIATEEAMFDAGRLIKQPAVESAIINQHGREIYNTIVNTLVTAKFGLEGASGILAHLRNGATVVGLGWKVSTALLQPLGISNSIVRVGGFWIAKGYARMGQDAATIQSSANWIMERSEFMRNRRQSNSPEMQALRGKLKAGVTDIRIPGVVMTKTAIDAVKNSAFAMMANTQFYSVDMPTWYGAYYKAKAAGMADGDAYAEADQAVIDAQGGGELHQTAAMQTGAGTRYAAALRLLTNFMSYMITTYNLSVQRIRSARTVGQIAALGFDLAIMLAVPVAGKMMIDAWTKGGGDDDDELLEKYMREQAAFLFSPFVGISQIAGSTRGEDAYGYRGPAGLMIFAEAGGAAKAAAEADFDESFWRPANKTAGMIFHYPASQIDASVRGALAYFNGETDNPAAFLVGPPPAN